MVKTPDLEQLGIVDDTDNKEHVNKNPKSHKLGVNINAEVDDMINGTPGKSADVALESPNLTPAPLPVSLGSKKPGRGRPPGVKRPKPPPVEISPQQIQKMPPEVGARLVNQAYESVLLVTLGSDAALDDAEKTALDAALVTYMGTKNYDIPPGLALCFCYAAITAGKVQKPKAKERMAGFFIRLKTRMGVKKKEKETAINRDDQK